MNPVTIQTQIDSNRRSVGFDSYDLSVRQLRDMITEGDIDVAPEYQRHFVWNNIRQSQLIESLILGIPVPSLFMATNQDSSWEVIDGLQRLTTIINFVGDDQLIQRINPNCRKLKINGLEKLESINNLQYEELPRSVQLLFLNRPVRVTVLNDRSDFEVRYDLFERLNTGGVILHPQEIRNCIFLGRFKDFIVECSQYPAFFESVKVGNDPEKNTSREELVLKFFAYYEDRELFIHSVKGFLNTYMKKKTDSFQELSTYQTLFHATFSLLQSALPQGIVRSNRPTVTPTVLFEAVSIGVADVITEGNEQNIDLARLRQVVDNEDLKRITSGASNSRTKLNQRINFVKEFIQP